MTSSVLLQKKCSTIFVSQKKLNKHIKEAHPNSFAAIAQNIFKLIMQTSSMRESMVVESINAQKRDVAEFSCVKKTWKITRKPTQG